MPVERDGLVPRGHVRKRSRRHARQRKRLGEQAHDRVVRLPPSGAAATRTFQPAPCRPTTPSAKRPARRVTQTSAHALTRPAAANRRPRRSRAPRSGPRRPRLGRLHRRKLGCSSAGGRIAWDSRVSWRLGHARAGSACGPAGAPAARPRLLDSPSAARSSVSTRRTSANSRSRSACAARVTDRASWWASAMISSASRLAASRISVEACSAATSVDGSSDSRCLTSSSVFSTSSSLSVSSPRSRQTSSKLSAMSSSSSSVVALPVADERRRPIARASAQRVCTASSPPP